MKNQFEAKFARVNVHQLRQIIKQIPNSQLIYTKKLIQRISYNLPNQKVNTIPYRWVIVKNDGTQIELSLVENLNRIKNTNDPNLVKELKIQTKGFQNINEFLISTGFHKITEAKVIREKWILRNIEFNFVKWPNIDTILKIVAPNNILLENAITKLDLDKTKAYYGPISEIYKKEYGIDYS